MQWYFLGISTVLTPVSIRYFDEPVQKTFQNYQNPYNNYFFKTVNYAGDGLVVSSAWVLLGVYGYVKRDTAIINLSKAGILGFVVSGGSVVALKVLFGRARPYLNKGPYEFSPFNLEDDYNSLPSGHTAVAFSVAGVVWRRVNNKFVRFSSIALATSVGLARIYLNRHWLSDVILGAGLGFTTGYISAGFVK
ncbi:MAG: phosphatase PAP2 family protein [candidate division WOR-3 bacterium]